jgi:thiol-disulfide isomerase/thioredoxin
MRRPLAIPTLIIAALGLSLSQRPAAGLAGGGFQPPAVHDLATRVRYASLGDSGSALLAAGKSADAIAVFTRMEKVIPGGPRGNFDIACVHGRAGDTAQALVALTAAVEAGFDNLRLLQSDPDLAPLLLDPAGAKLVRRSAENYDRHLAYLSSGLPAVQPFPVPPESLDTYASLETRKIYDQAGVWHQWQLRSALIDLRARQLESVRALRKDDPALDFPLIRMRILASAAPIGERWGVLADGVTKEAKAYLAGKPSPAGRAEAEYDLAVAAISREFPKPSSPAWAAASAEAGRLFAQVDTSSAQAGAAAAWRVALDLIGADAGKPRLYPQVREFASKYWDDASAKAVANAFFARDLIDAHWPIPLSAVDLDGKPVSLDEYRGKLLLIDFWATWCAPCRLELPGLREAYSKYHDRGLEVVSISFDFPKATPPEKYRAWVTQSGMAWRHIYDQKGFQGPLARSFFIYSIPAAILVGRDGSVVAMSDDLRGKNLAATIERAL